VAPSDLGLVVKFGTGFPGNTCTDLADEIRQPVVDETWPATAAGATFTVDRGEQCSVATLELRDVVVTAPSGATVPLGRLVLANPAWQWWPPFECALDEAGGA
jgi:hypothetical protein